jgi:hypothetical protein
MKTTRIFLIISLVLAVGSLGYGFGQARLWVWTVIIGIGGVLWCLSRFSSWELAPSLFFASFIAFSATGSMLGLSPIFVFGGVIASLIAWDLDRFYQRWKTAEPFENQRRLEFLHLRRLLWVCCCAAGSLIVGVLLEFRFNFMIMLLFGALAVLGLGRAIGLLRAQGEDQ